MHPTVLSAYIALALTLVGVRAQLPQQATTPCIQNCLDRAASLVFPACYVNVGSSCYCGSGNDRIQQDAFSCLQQECTAHELAVVQEIVAANCALRTTSTSAAVPAHSEAPYMPPPQAPSAHHASSFEAHTSEQKSAVIVTT
ncbi:hypothetical protein V8D89_001394 [Ganoderma adspersum]